MKLRASFLGLTAALALSAAPARAAHVNLIQVKSAISPPVGAFILRAIKLAERDGASALIIQLDTPGGLITTTDEIQKGELNAQVPVVVWVAPAGARAASAGTFITISAHVAAMHPVSRIGAASPVSLVLPGMAPPSEDEKDKKQARPPQETAVEMVKITNDLIAGARVAAELHGRNADWVEKAIREAVVATAPEALRLKVVDLLASDLRELLGKLEGRKVEVEGREVILHTRGLPAREIPATQSERFLSVLADPNILIILLALAAIGIFFELQNPGAILPGVIGGICFFLALYSMSALPINYAGLGLILFAFLLFIADLKVASHGILTVGGVISFLMGGLMLIDTSWAPAMRVSWYVALAVGGLLAAFFLFALGAYLHSKRRQVITGKEGLIGSVGRATSSLSPGGQVFVAGEIWRARAEGDSIPEGEEVEVVRLEGFTVVVRPRGRKS